MNRKDTCLDVSAVSIEEPPATAQLHCTAPEMVASASQAQKDELQFAYVVKGKGTVAGVLYYFPFDNERENVPMEPLHHPLHGSAGAMGLTQHPAGTQLALTQARTSPEPEGEL